MFATAFRLFVRAQHEGVAAEIGPAALIVNILKQHGELNKHDIWKHCEDAGVKSKRQMKLTLRWLKEKNHINIVCAAKDFSAMPEQPMPPRQSKKKRSGTPPPTDKEFTYKLAPRYFPKNND